MKTKTPKEVQSEGLRIADFGVWNAEVLPPKQCRVKSEECGVRPQTTDHRPRSKVQSSPRAVRGRKFLQLAAFTLIELLIVIGIIVLLAGMLFTALPAIQRAKTTSRLKNELAQVQTAIDAYKAKKGYYPPDNPGNPNPAVNQLYYELIGTRLTNDQNATPPGTYFYTIDGSARIMTNAMPGAFGSSSVAGFDNCTHGGGDDVVRAENFLKGGLRSGQFLATSTTSSAGPPSVLGSAIDGKFMIGKVNPWRYNSSSPTNNPGTYDLWIDYDFGGKSNRICNWSDKAIQLQ